MKLLTHPAVVAFGLSNLLLLALTGPLISTDHDLVYHLIGAATPIFLPVLAYLALLWLLLTALLIAIDRPASQPALLQPAEPTATPTTRLKILTWTTLLSVLLWTLLHTAAGFSAWIVPTWLDLLAAAAILITLTLAVTRTRAITPAFDRAQPIAALILSFSALSGLLIVAELVFFGLQSRTLNPPTQLHHSALSAPANQHPRILWIVLDELSHNQLYEHRFPNLQLSAFDQLAAQSTTFTHVIPAGEYTRAILPSLLTGIPSNRIRVNAHGNLLSLHNPIDNHWHPFDPHQTVFADALTHGYRTGLAGWYNPYCRILPNLLDSCFWTYHESTPAALSPTASAPANLLTPLLTLTRIPQSLLHPSTPPASPMYGTDDASDLAMHTADYRELLTASDTLLADPTLDFTLLHLPIPHPFGFYDRRTHTFSTHHTSYLDNLALADQYLAHVRHILEAQNQWDSTTIVLMGDHSWRTSFIWLNSGTWTPEDNQASHGGEFDDRPAYLVKLPHQHQPSRIDDPFDALRTRALLDALMSNTLKTPADLTRWTQPTQ